MVGGGEMVQKAVTSREGRVSRNMQEDKEENGWPGHVPRGACE